MSRRGHRELRDRFLKVNIGSGMVEIQTCLIALCPLCPL